LEASAKADWADQADWGIAQAAATSQATVPESAVGILAIVRAPGRSPVVQAVEISVIVQEAGIWVIVRALSRVVPAVGISAAVTASATATLEADPQSVTVVVSEVDLDSMAGLPVQPQAAVIPVSAVLEEVAEDLAVVEAVVAASEAAVAAAVVVVAAVAVVVEGGRI